MTISIEKKVPLLHNFHSYLYEPDWRFMESKEKHRQVLEDFPTVVELQISAYGYVYYWWYNVTSLCTCREWLNKQLEGNII